MGARTADGEAATFELWPPRARGGLDPRRPGELADRLARFRRAYLAQPDCRALGSLQILDLERVRARLGRRWAELRPKIFLNVEACIAHRLEPDELYLVLDETTVWIFALGAYRADVDRRGQLIAADVTERLLGVLPGGTAVGVRTMLLDFDAGLRGVAGLGMLRERVETQARRLAEAEARAFADHVDRLVTLYRPILSLAPPCVVGYRAFARLSGPDGTLVPPDTACPDRATGGFEAALDRWLADRVAAELERPSGDGRAPFLMLPVHDATLASAATRERWLARLLGPTRGVARRLLVELVDPPPGGPGGRLGGLAPRLAGSRAALVLRCPLETEAVREAAGEGVGTVSLDAAALDPADPGTAPRLAAVAAACRAEGLCSLVVGVASAALAEQARAAGIELMAGDACLPPLRAPGAVVGLGPG